LKRQNAYPNLRSKSEPSSDSDRKLASAARPKKSVKRHLLELASRNEGCVARHAPLPVQVVDGLNLRLVNQFGSEHLGNRDIELETFSE
jgi:hypothetical protein